MLFEVAVAIWELISFNEIFKNLIWFQDAMS